MKQYDYSSNKIIENLNSISVEMSVLNWFESANKNPSTVDGISNLFYMSSLIGHEGSHWGNNIKGTGNTRLLNHFLNNERQPEHGDALEFKLLNGIYRNAKPNPGLNIGSYNWISSYLIDYVKKNFKTLSNIFNSN